MRGIRDSVQRGLKKYMPSVNNSLAMQRVRIDKQIEQGLSFSSVAAAKQVRPQNLEEYEVDAETESCLSEKFFPPESA